MTNLLNEIKYELFESQAEIIRLQSDAIIGLLSIISQHKDIKDEDFKTIKENIDLAAQIRAEHNL